MPDKNNNENFDFFNEFLHGLMRNQNNSPNNEGNANSSEPSFEQFFNDFSKIFDEKSDSTGTNPTPSNNPNDILYLIFGGEKGTDNDPSTQDLNNFIQNMMKSLVDGQENSGLPPISAEEFSEINRIVVDIINSLGKPKKNPLEDVDTSDLDSELKEFLKQNMNKNFTNTESEKDPSTNEDKSSYNEGPTREIARNVKASVRKKSEVFVLKMDHPNNIDENSLTVNVSLDNETVSVGYTRSGDKFEQVVRVNGIKDRGIVAFSEKGSSTETLDDGTLVITLGIVENKTFSL